LVTTGFFRKVSVMSSFPGAEGAKTERLAPWPFSMWILPQGARTPRLGRAVQNMLQRPDCLIHQLYDMKKSDNSLSAALRSKARTARKSPKWRPSGHSASTPCARGNCRRNFCCSKLGATSSPHSCRSIIQRSPDCAQRLQALHGASMCAHAPGALPQRSQAYLLAKRFLAAQRGICSGCQRPSCSWQ
jgi:hypothetical protein